MGVLIRGIKNAFRNIVRTLSIVLILAISVGLSLIMLLSYQTIQSKIDSVKSSIGNTITLTPAGANGFEGGGEPLTEQQVSGIQNIPHITKITSILLDRISPNDGSNNLLSAIDPGTLGNRSFRFFGQEGFGGGNIQRTFSIPISVTGISDISTITSLNPTTIGSLFDPTKNANNAIMGSGIATKNNLKVGSTFTAYSTTFTVNAIINIPNNRFANDGFYIPISTMQNLSQQSGDVSIATVQVDSISNVNSTVTAITNKLGSNVDVTSSQDSANQALAPLQSIQTISLYSLIGAIVAGSVVMLLAMVMIVRERRKEIGVLKAIGASNINIILQFIYEALVLTILGGAIGMILGVLLSNPVLNALLASSTTPNQGISAGMGRGGFFRIVQGVNVNSAFSTIRNLHTVIDVHYLIYGFIAVLLIAIIGSAIPAWLIAKISPAEVLRGE